MKLHFVGLLGTMALSACLCHAQLATTAAGKFVNVNGAKIYYEEYGQGDPLLLLHGFGQTANDWQEFIPAFSKKYHVVVWDMRGHGRSTNPVTVSEVRLLLA